MDNDIFCEFLKWEGYCEKEEYKNYMEFNCKRICNLCWRRIGEFLYVDGFKGEVFISLFVYRKFNRLLNLFMDIGLVWGIFCFLIFIYLKIVIKYMVWVLIMCI